MKSQLFLTLSMFVSACQSFAQNPAYSPIEININSNAIRWVQSVPPNLKTHNASSGDTFDNFNTKPDKGLDFSKVPNGFLGIGLNTSQNIYGFISEEVVVTLQSKEAATELAKLNANCKIIVENLQMYVCKASSVPHLQSLVTRLQAMPTVKQASPQFVTNFNKPM